MAQDILPNKRILSASESSGSPTSISTTQFPIFRLPLEIITEIFLMLCQPNKKNLLPDGSGILCNTTRAKDTKIQPITPFFLGSICRTWRLAVWNTPILWSSIALHPSSVKETHSAQLQLLEEWIARSGAFPLSICLTTDRVEAFEHRNEVPWWDGPGPFEIYRILDSYAERWRDLEIIIPDPIYFNFQYHFPRINIQSPNLFSLSLGPPDGVDLTLGPILGDITVLSDAAPLLRNVTLKNFDLSDVELPWSQLFSFTTIGLTAEECMEILQQCSSLKHCLFRDFEWRGIQTGNGTLLLPNITSFELHTTDNTDATKMLHGCSCPALQELVIHINPRVCHESTDLLAATATFLSRFSSSSLRHLSLHGISLDMGTSDDNPYLIGCLEAVQSIETLEISLAAPAYLGVDQGLTPYSWERFDPRKATVYPERKVLLPNLQRFSYKGAVNFKFVELIDVLKCRWECGSTPEDPIRQLKSVEIEIYNDLGDDDRDTGMRHLEELLNSGMDVSFYYIY